MQTWKVTTPTGDRTLQAMTATTTEAGDLVFKRQDGGVIHAFAKGGWVECVLVNPFGAVDGQK